jgi:prepilin-type N-terminal cleavage/methylation domain-containing protein/prepilin-type processing-associated H-X9-DG protein
MSRQHLSQHHRRGFTLVEMMMVILIIGLLAALLTNALQSSREMGRRTQCTNKMREAGQAAILFETKHNGYPGWVHPVASAAGSPNNSWIYQILPALGRDDLADRSVPLAQLVTVSLNDLLVCPSDHDKLASQAGLTSLVCNAGRRDAQATATTPADWRSNAVCVNRDDRPGNTLVKVDVTDSSFVLKGDGLAVTLLLSENIDALTWHNVVPSPVEWVNGILFWPPDSGGNFPPLPVHAINGPNTSGAPSYDTARPSSYHPGGVNVFFCDGHGRFVSEGIDYGVYCALMTPRGRNAMEPGTTTPTPHPQITNWPQISEDTLNE